MLRRSMLALAVTLAILGVAAAGPPPDTGQLLAHNVYFSLNDKSEAAAARLVAACHQYLKDHPGVVFFAAGTLAADLNRDVNDRDFDVALHMVFRSKADHDRYQVHEKHKQFIDENRPSWARVRVFDSYVK